MRVFFVGSKYDGCFYARCMVPMRENGWAGTRMSLRGLPLSAKDVARNAMVSDVVVFHRPDFDQRIELMKLLQENGKKVVFDNDDTYVPNSGVPMGKFFGAKEAELIETWNKKIYEAIGVSDLVTCSTETLAEEYRHLHPNVVVMPNLVDPDDWPEPEHKPSPKLRVGIVGSVASTGDWEVIKPFLDTIKDEVQLVVMGLPRRDHDHATLTEIFQPMFDYFDACGTEYRLPVPMADYPHELLDMNLDLCLIPRTDNYFNRCKSNIKFLEMSMLEIPVIASGFEDGRSPYQGKDEPYMRVCVTLDDWAKAYENLKDRRTREALGKAAREYVLGNYHIKDHAHLWRNEYLKLLEPKSS